MEYSVLAYLEIKIKLQVVLSLVLAALPYLMRQTLFLGNLLIKKTKKKEVGMKGMKMQVKVLAVHLPTQLRPHLVKNL